MATISGAKTRFVNSMHTENDTMDAPAQGSRTQLNDMAMPTTSSVESVVQNLHACHECSIKLTKLAEVKRIGKGFKNREPELLVLQRLSRPIRSFARLGRLCSKEIGPGYVSSRCIGGGEPSPYPFAESYLHYNGTDCFTGDGATITHCSNLFPQMLVGFCKALSPLKVLIDYPQYKALKRSHLLDLMYHLIILKNSPTRNPDKELDKARFI
ncbi:hypothetical protein TorRG33x02_300030 [Trema orientale]|uniref:Uncharacterized protein n=1 Tax=Trema orientale TaxID=63057 RepID=A0A2P5C291_TREOI|nr:hypothetical protein TorRG33x02_300030 [Trema orientale]